MVSRSLVDNNLDDDICRSRGKQNKITLPGRNTEKEFVDEKNKLCRCLPSRINRLCQDGCNLVVPNDALQIEGGGRNQNYTCPMTVNKVVKSMVVSEQKDQ